MKFIALSAIMASFPTSIIAGPVEHARIRIQIQTSGTAAAYEGSIDAGKKIMGEFGVKGLYKGFWPTLGR